MIKMSRQRELPAFLARRGYEATFEIADVLEENVELIRKIYDVIKELGEEYTEDAALEKILK